MEDELNYFNKNEMLWEQSDEYQSRIVEGERVLTSEEIAQKTRLS